MKQVFNLFFTIASISLVLSACSKSSGGGGGGGGTSLDCNTVTNKAFTADVNPIIQTTCNISGCHAAGSTNGPGALTTHAEVFAARARVRTAISTGDMPRGTTLSTAQKNSIICWIDSGAPNN